MQNGQTDNDQKQQPPPPPVPPSSSIAIIVIGCHQCRSSAFQMHSQWNHSRL